MSKCIIINEMLNDIVLRAVMYYLKVSVFVRKETRSTRNNAAVQLTRGRTSYHAITVLVHSVAYYT